MEWKGNGMNIEKRSQAERIVIAAIILGHLWKEFAEGKIEKDIKTVMQAAVDMQVICNRIVWKLNTMEESDGMRNKPSRTNADVIREMTDEELADWIISITEDDTPDWHRWIKQEV